MRHHDAEYSLIVTSFFEAPMWSKFFAMVLITQLYAFNAASEPKQTDGEKALCKNAEAGAKKRLTSDRESKSPTTGQKFSEQVTLGDGFSSSKTGIRFGQNEIVQWGDSADLYFAMPGGKKNLFVKHWVPETANGSNELDKESFGGMWKIATVDPINGVECPKPDAEFRRPSEKKNKEWENKVYHWIEPEAQGTYCLLTRDGNHFALLEIAAVCESTMVFSYRYNEKENDRFFPAEFAPPTQPDLTPVASIKQKLN